MAEIGYLQVTRDCNQKCRFCSNPPSGMGLSIEDARVCLEEMKREGYQGVILTGGEPTISPFLPDLVRHAIAIGLSPRVITNGQRIADKSYLSELYDTGLRHIHVSIQSCRPEVQNFLSRNPASFAKILEAMRNLASLPGIRVDVNTTILHYNADHLHETAAWVVRNFPFVRHFVWNNLDPETDRCMENRDTIPLLPEFELSLAKAMRFLHRHGITFRVERVPLCYMADFPECSTETRKIVKGERRVVHFLDQKGKVVQEEFIHGKAGQCRHCSWDSICAGLYGMRKHYDPRVLYPIFLPAEPVRKKVLGL